MTSGVGVWRWIELSRVHKFAGSMLIFWPLAWGMTMAAHLLSMSIKTYLFDLVYGLIGAALLHSAGCVWNDVLDREFDRKVERTKHRPIADGRVSVQGALVFLALHLVLLVALLWPVNPLAWKLGLVVIFPLPGIYPLMKRVTYWPQAWLGIAVNTISLVAWSALRAELTLAAVALLTGCCCWTLYYDTIYACQDKRDDVKVGVKSTALLFGRYIKGGLVVFAGLMLTCLTIAGKSNGQQAPYFLITIGGGAAHLTWQLLTLDPDDAKSCLVAFESNGFALGGIIWAGLFSDYLLA
ncbi:UbiA prenyltransferase family [Gloeopeniophorella convolvens]|nr:UbiA prenyltransferase family [Gloeopeniophorella convolvens]